MTIELQFRAICTRHRHPHLKRWAANNMDGSSGVMGLYILESQGQPL
jgi:hypothetical protein